MVGFKIVSGTCPLENEIQKQLKPRAQFTRGKRRKELGKLRGSLRSGYTTTQNNVLCKYLQSRMVFREPVVLLDSQEVKEAITEDEDTTSDKCSFFFKLVRENVCSSHIVHLLNARLDMGHSKTDLQAAWAMRTVVRLVRKCLCSSDKSKRSSIFVLSD